MTTQKQASVPSPDQAVALMQKAINLNKQAATLTQKATVLTQQANVLLTMRIPGPHDQGIPSTKQSQKKRKKKAPITQEAAARIQSAADRQSPQEAPRSEPNMWEDDDDWDDDDY